ncbi:outer membrane beta-barrel protein [Cellulophaga baltica]|uniref:outer membrane protein n=1 Tax=Cellulophaga TaxID=104264 RepID=UPI001C06B005|nr:MULTISPECIES: outer membrane beta-barrel protein [Cellulophaga]MBU2997659.1 outer membrane beta-barrel protein [Cellulophaga baltica]MDO6769054.1 outer membrane beta-barrel protein [Cellulophaga sp. 1_MG-2023]
MKNLYFLTISMFLIATSLCAQDQKWSIEANYPISVGEDLGNDVPGIIDLGLKYRFVDLNIVKLGASINAGVLNGNVGSGDFDNSIDFDETDWLIQPRVFTDITIPTLSKLHPSVGLGYTFIESKFDGSSFGESFDNTESFGGLNINLGLSYDIINRIFVQVQYDYVRSNYDYEVNDVEYENDQNLGFLKLGVGFRF